MGKIYGYRVRLADGTYLKAEHETGEFTQYDQGDARKKARRFGGKMERFKIPVPPPNAYTSGPWRVERLSNHVWVMADEVRGGKSTHLYLTEVVTSDEEHRLPRNTETIMANARLMAAAPELLEVCQKTVIDLRDFADPDGEFKPTPEGLLACVRDIEKVITRATGE